MDNLVGKGRDALGILLDTASFTENLVGGITLDSTLAPGAVVGTGKLRGRTVTVIANDAKARNPRFPGVTAGIIGMEEAYKMARTVYATIAADSGQPQEKKRPLLLVVDTPGNGLTKIEEIIGMNKATGSYQLALAEARQHGHPVVAMIVGRAISGAFLCHGLQADRILTLSERFATMIHVMPLAGIARITKRDIETLEALAKTNPVFASGAGFFHRLGGVEEIIDSLDGMADALARHIDEVYTLNAAGESRQNGPWGRGLLGETRGGRTARAGVLRQMADAFEAVEAEYL